MSRPAPTTYPHIEILGETDEAPVTLMVWHIRAVYGAKVKGKDGTRIEFTNGDTFDSVEPVERVLSLLTVATNGRVPGGRGT